ncbi:uncharacterized protein MELLADRAFT_103103 [Melampsora larici-populina 98AG31]|uniref:Mitochondrial carrier protein n=1 Tax=Melampsora larici-populina (strain 98AG31 / pathotype 3-4-7) TaxID=747676 RepID=F4RAJ9_MELLP|nr:uncharacterized protein MELLADRAFT_103103 [Melampsora larici-populina 98AG31]EGG10494.1 hypothetical protein MELLADRAFT_103103 [Melampsora larici-populina 98AG31]
MSFDPSSSSASSSSSNIPNPLISSTSSTSSQPKPLIPEPKPKPPGWVHFLAGGLGGMCGATVTAPFDLIKTRLQSSMYHHHQTTSNHHHIKSLEPRRNFEKVLYHFKDTGRMIREIQRTEGFRALFRGLGPTLAGAIPARSINFYVYGTCKEVYQEVLNPTSHPNQSSSLVHIFSAITAGIATSTATNPIWVIKTRLQLDIPTTTTTSNRSPNTSIKTVLKPSIDCMTRIYSQEGLLGFYRGLSASYLGVAEGTIQWTLYEKFKTIGIHQSRSGELEGQGQGQECWWNQVLAAGSAKLLATGITYPHEVVRTRMRQKRPIESKVYKYDGLLMTFRTVFQEEGIRAFYGGLPAHLLRVVPNAIVMYTVYETALSISRKKLESS